MQTKIDPNKTKAVHAKMRENPYKNAAMAMSREVSDSDIVSNLKGMRNAKREAGEAPPEPVAPQQRLTHPNNLDHARDATAHAMGEGADRTEQFEDHGGHEAMGHHKQSTKASLHETLQQGGAQETAHVQESGAGEGGDDDGSPALSHVDRIHRSFSSPKSKKRTVNVGSKSDFKTLHARSMNKSRSKE